MTASGVVARPPRALGAATTVCTLIASVIVVYAARWGPDWPAQEFRAWIAVHDGLSTWTARWYGGAPLPGYSVLYPWLARLVGAGGVGLAAVAATAWVATGLAPRDRRRAVLFSAVVTVNLVQTLLIGQVPFLLGTAFGVAAFRSLVGGRHWILVAVMAALSSLATPLAGTFLVLLGPACAVTLGMRRALPLAAGLVGPGVALAVGGAAGPFPLPWLLFVSTLAFCVLVAALSPPGHRGLRVFAACYLAATVLLFLVPNPIGGNIARLGKLIALPLACHYLVLGTLWLRLRTAIIATLATLWPTAPFLGAIAHGADDPSQSESFYSGVAAYLHTHQTSGGRVEIPLTREHWEAFWLAKRTLIARGWERQTDYRYNQVLYEPLTPGRYQHWLSENAVEFVALPDVPIDVGGSAEARLLNSPPAYLDPVWHDAHWQVWRVRGASRLATGATLRDLDASSMELDFHRPGVAEVKVRYDPLWHVAAGHACIAATPAGWIAVRATRPGRVQLDAGLNGQMLASPSKCRG